MTQLTTQKHDMQEQLQRVLQETFALYQDTHMAHWNVRGPYFPQLHVLFEQHYTELWEALDVLAERIRALGSKVNKKALVAEPRIVDQDHQEMVRDLASAHRELSGALRSLEETAADAGDPATADLATERVRAHDQAAWMLEATAADW